MKRVVIEEFNSIDKFIKIINARENNHIMRNEHSSRNEDYSFTKTKSYKEAEELLKFGYEDILPQIQKQMNKKMKGQISQRRMPYNHVVGFAPNVPNAIRGIPQSMINKTVVANKSRTVSIIYSPTGCGHISADEFVKCGVVILNVINNLELNGIRVNLKIANKVSEDNYQQNECCFCCVKVKDYRDHLDLKKLAFPIAHPSFFRRFGFKWLETVPTLTSSKWSSGYGATISIQKFKEYFPNDKLIDIRDVRDMNYDVEKIIDSFKLD